MLSLPMAWFARLCVALLFGCVRADYREVLPNGEVPRDLDVGASLVEKDSDDKITASGARHMIRREESQRSSQKEEPGKLASIRDHSQREIDGEETADEAHEEGQKRRIPRITRQDLQDIIAKDSNISRVLDQRGPFIVTDALVNPHDWQPTDPACSTGHAKFGVEVTPYMKDFEKTWNHTMLDRIAKAAHNKTWAELLHVTLNGTPTVAEYSKYVANLDVADDLRPSEPDFPDIVAEAARVISMPLSAHDIQLAVFCPNRLHDWTLTKLLGEEIQSSLSSLYDDKHVFWGPRGSQPYPMHTNGGIMGGPSLKFMTRGRQEVAIFPRSESKKLMPLNPYDGEDPHPASVFRADALGPPEVAAHYGDYVHATGWKDEITVGDLLFFNGRFPHQFNNPVQSFSVVFF